MRWLITGADGFVASHLLPYLLAANGDDQFAAMVWRELPSTLWPAPTSRLEILPGDMNDPASVRGVINHAQPAVILHLASASSVAESWQDPEPVYRTNVLGQLRLLEAARQLEPMPRVVIASSGEVYGRDGHDGRPIGEDAPLRPMSPYAVSKAVQDLQAWQYHAAYGLPTVRLRLFNHTGPGRPPHFVASSFARQLAEIELGRREPVLRVGDLDVARDFSDVRDVVRAWRLAALEGEPGAAYNVCSGRATPIRRILDTLVDAATAAVDVTTDPALLRTGEIMSLAGDNSAIAEATGWRPEIPLEKTLIDLLEWWREELS